MFDEMDGSHGDVRECLDQLVLVSKAFGHRWEGCLSPWKEWLRSGCAGRIHESGYRQIVGCFDSSLGEVAESAVETEDAVVTCALVVR